MMLPFFIFANEMNDATFFVFFIFTNEMNDATYLHKIELKLLELLTRNSNGIFLSSCVF